MKRHIPTRTQRRPRCGVTLVEILVVFGMVAILMALLLPAVQWTRERARLVQCKSRLSQLAVAFHSYHSDHGCLPVEWYPHQRVLPYLELASLYQELDSFRDHVFISEDTPPVVPWPAEGLEVFVCPSDPEAQSRWGHSNYQLNLGSGIQRYGENGLRLPRRLPFQFTRMSDVTDGLSVTSCLAEHLVERGVSEPAEVRQDPIRRFWHTPVAMTSPSQLDQFADVCQGNDVAPLIGFHVNASRWLFYPGGYNHILTPNTKPCGHGPLPGTYAFSDMASVPASSRHAHGVNVMFADGHVAFIAQSIDRTVWRDYGSRNGGESVP